MGDQRQLLAGQLDDREPGRVAGDVAYRDRVVEHAAAREEAALEFDGVRVQRREQRRAPRLEMCGEQLGLARRRRRAVAVARELELDQLAAWIVALEQVVAVDQPRLVGVGIGVHRRDQIVTGELAVQLLALIGIERDVRIGALVDKSIRYARPV